MTKLFNFAPVKMTETLRKFINEHSKDDLSKLLLSASRYENVDVKNAVVQIKARNSIKDKLPSWYDNDRLLFPSTLAAEQCSSEITALYKQRFVTNTDCLCDLTGGLGVDTYFFSGKARGVIYVERNEDYCNAARYNMDILGASNVSIVNGDAVALVTNEDDRISDVNVFYIDPARRGAGDKRMFAIGDCEPDMNKLWSLLRDKRCKIIVKLSPMLDIMQVLTQLPGICEMHIVSVKNECKELLAVSASPTPTLPQGEGGNQTDIICVNYTSGGDEQIFRFSLSDEQYVDACMADGIGRYLYEPNSSIMKAGAYKTVALHYKVKKFHVSSHLYTSESPVYSFPGRIFEVTDVIPFSNRTCKTLSSEIPQANITVRNFPLSVDELRKRTHITDGGNVYLFATTLSDGRKVLIKCLRPSFYKTSVL